LPVLVKRLTLIVRLDCALQMEYVTGNAKGGSISELLTSCLTCTD